MTYPYSNYRKSGARPSPRGRRRERGLTLVELMIAMLLGLVLTAGVVQIFIGNRTTYAFSEGLSWIQENARFAVDHMANHTRMAGHAGCLAGTTVFNNLAGGTNDFRDDLAAGLHGHDFDATAYSATAVDPTSAGSAADWWPPLPDELDDPHVLPGSDVLVVRYVSGEATPLISPFSNSGQLFVDSADDLGEGDILVVTDCQKASIFQLTKVEDVGPGPGLNLVHSNDNKFTPSNSTPTWGPQQSYGLGAEVARLVTVAFYVGRGNSGAPSLFQARLNGAGATLDGFEHEELIEGVDTMQVRYGLDSDGDRQVDAWQTADAVADWTAVLSVEVSLLARADEEYGTETDTAVYDIGGMQFDPVDDRRLRQVFTTTIGLRNRLP